MVDVAIAWDHPGREPIVSQAEAAGLMALALDREGRDGEWSFGIRFVDDAEMRARHEEFMQDPSSTDIMTFPYDVEDGEQGGDIMISVDTAVVNATEHGWRLEEELRFLLLHGLLHILGWDDHDEADRRAMLDRQAELLESWNADRRENTV